MSRFRCALLLLAAAVSALLLSSPAAAQSTTSAVQWGYVLQCPPFTLDYPCQVRVSGTATSNSTVQTATVSSTALVNNGTQYSYYAMLNFTGTRAYTNRFGDVSTTAITALAPVGTLGAVNRLALSSNGLISSTPVYRLASRVQVTGGLVADSIRLIVAAGGFPSESVAINGYTGTNSLNADPTTVTVCSTAPSFAASGYDATTGNAAFSASMTPCTTAPTYTLVARYTAAQTTPGLQNFAFTYSITDGATFAAQVNATLQTDGTVNFDQLGNLYYQIIAIQGTRSEQSLINVSAVSTVFITSLLAPNLIATSNVPYITNNNRFYLTYPFLDRYGFAYTVSSIIGQVTQPELEDGYIDRYTNSVGVYIYREDTLDEQGLDGQFAYPKFNALNQQYNNLTLTLIPTPAEWILVGFCYVFYGLNNTIDYPWGVVLNGTGLINSTLMYRNTTDNVRFQVVNPQPVYSLLGFVGIRNFTNRFGQSVISAVTADQLGEDANVGLLSPVTPYTVSNSVSFHLNGTIQTPGGLPATDMSFFLNPFPIEGTAFGYGIGTGTNALNNDPSRTVIASNMPGFTLSTYEDSDINQYAGTVHGTTDLSQCRVVLTTVPAPSSTVLATGLRVWNLTYQVVGSTGYTSQAQLQLITDGSVNTDQLGNTYYTIILVTGTRVYSNVNGTVVASNRAVALLPICSGPPVSNLNNIYCSNNRLFPQYPYVDRLGFAYQLDASVPRFGTASPAFSREVGLVTYREVVLEESYGTNSPVFNESSAALPNITLVQDVAAAAQLHTFSFGYLLYCLPSSLEYPCAVYVQGTVLALNTTYLSQCNTSATYSPLCSQPGYQILGFTGNRTFVGKYGQTQLSYMSIEAVGEDYADNLIYLSQPYVDTNGPTFHLNGSASGSALVPTQVIGGLSTNEINLFLYSGNGGALSEGIAVNGASSSALLYNQSSAMICSTMPGFVPAPFNVNSRAPAGVARMSACIPSLPTQPVPAFTSTIVPLIDTFAYSVSDGVTFASQVVVTLTSDDVARVDALGNRYFLIVGATGTRTYFNFSTGAQIISQIIGVLPAGNYSFGSALSGSKNSNRFYPFSYPYVDALGVAFQFAAPAPLDGISSNTASTILLQYYKDGTLEELPVTTRTGGRYPLPALQSAQLTTGAAAISLPTPVPLQSASLCLIFYSLPGSPEYPWSSAISLTVQYNPTAVVTAAGSGVRLISGSGTRTFTNKYGASSTINVTLFAPGTYGNNDNIVYTGTALPFDANGITLYLGTQTAELPGHGPTLQYGQLHIYQQNVSLFTSTSATIASYITEDASARIDPLGSAFISTLPGFVNTVLGGANANAGAVVYATCQAPITFANGVRAVVSPNTFNVCCSKTHVGAVRVAYSYFVSDGATYTITTNLTLTMDSALANSVDALGNQYQTVVGVAGTRVYVYLPTGETITSTVSGVSNGAYQYADQRFYPYALLGASPSIYSINQAPFVDYDGIEFNISPSAPAAGLPPGQGTQYSQTSVYTEARELSYVLVDGYFYPSNGFQSSGPTGIPVQSYQQQRYTLLQ